MVCPKKILVTYSEGPHFDKVAEVYPRHAKFIRETLEKKFLWMAGLVQGTHTGLSVYHSGDTAAVEAVVKQDPFVAEGVVVYKLDTWGVCHLPADSK